MSSTPRQPTAIETSFTDNSWDQRDRGEMSQEWLGDFLLELDG